MAEYIERDKLLDAVFELPPKMDAQGYGWIARGGLCQLIRDFPSADVQPVVHGHWETEICDDGYGAYNLFVCSLCGSESAKRFNYCRECGARMDALWAYQSGECDSEPCCGDCDFCDHIPSHETDFYDDEEVKQ